MKDVFEARCERVCVCVCFVCIYLPTHALDACIELTMSNRVGNKELNQNQLHFFKEKHNGKHFKVRL